MFCERVTTIQEEKKNLDAKQKGKETLEGRHLCQPENGRSQSWQETKGDEHISGSGNS